MKTRVKDLFKGASQNTADFFTSNYMEEQMPAGREPNIDMRGDPEANLDMQKKVYLEELKMHLKMQVKTHITIEFKLIINI